MWVTEASEPPVTHFLRPPTFCPTAYPLFINVIKYVIPKQISVGGSQILRGVLIFPCLIMIDSFFCSVYYRNNNDINNLQQSHILCYELPQM